MMDIMHFTLYKFMTTFFTLISFKCISCNFSRRSNFQNFPRELTPRPHRRLTPAELGIVLPPPNGKFTQQPCSWDYPFLSIILIDINSLIPFLMIDFHLLDTQGYKFTKHARFESGVTEDKSN